MKKFIPFLIIFILILTVVFIFKPEEKQPAPAKTETSASRVESDVAPKSNEKTPEQVLEEMEARENPEVQGPLSAEIISPEGETFKMSQARYYKASIVNGLSNSYKRTECNWKFYLNEYSEEVLYKEMSVPMTEDHCGFTSTFIDKKGQLRVVLEVKLSDKKTQEVLDSFTTERSYLVN